MAMTKRKPHSSSSAQSDNDKSRDSKPVTSTSEKSGTSSTSLVLTVTLALILAGASYLYTTGSSNSIKTDASLTRLPESYALCTQEAGKVYTVTGEEGNGTADCLLVRKDRILGTGTIG